MNTVIVVPSRHRSTLFSRIVPSLETAGIPLVLVVEKADAMAYEPLLPSVAVSMRVLPKSNQGVGYARQAGLVAASELGFSHMIMLDDDVVVPENVGLLSEAVEKYGLSACCGWFRIMKHFIGIEQGTGVHPNTGGMGARCYAVNVDQLMSMGGYDTQLRTLYDDFDIAIRLARRGVGPWGIHSDVVLGSLAGRHEAGGNSSVTGGLSDNDKAAADLMRRKHGDIFTNGAKPKMKWKKVYTDAGFQWPLRLDDDPNEWDF